MVFSKAFDATLCLIGSTLPCWGCCYGRMSYVPSSVFWTTKKSVKDYCSPFAGNFCAWDISFWVWRGYWNIRICEVCFLKSIFALIKIFMTPYFVFDVHKNFKCFSFHIMYYMVYISIVTFAGISHFNNLSKYLFLTNSSQFYFVFWSWTFLLVQ